MDAGHWNPVYKPGFAFIHPRRTLTPDELIEQEFIRQKKLAEIIKNIPLGDYAAKGIFTEEDEKKQD